ncbi:MAG: IS1634 family transposase, partial [Actinobacteria bacterium]|nr:IS1634 family transposase [Actinomycetota bacterium]
MSEQPFQLSSQTLGALPIVDAFLARMRVDALLGRVLPAADARVALAPARAIGLLVRNLCVSREPIYALGEWAAPFDPALLGLDADEVVLLNDDRVGRALDQLFDADRASLLTQLILGVIGEFGVDCSQLHNDSTSITLTGAYRSADGHDRAGKPTPAAAHGHNKDHRPDLKQLLWILTVSADGAVPVAHRLTDGNTTDDQTHVATWDELRAVVGRPDFLYVADCKLCTREQMAHIDSNGGRFVTVLPRSRREDGFLRDWAHAHQPDWTEALRRPGKRKDDPDETWHVAPAPIPSAEGHRIVWVRSSQKTRTDADVRQQRIERGLHALAVLNDRLAGPKSRLRDRVSVEQAATAAIAGAQAERWITFTVTETTEETIRQEKRGRPGKNTRYRKITRTHWHVEHAVDAAAVAYDAASDGCFPLISNDHELTGAELLVAYRYQPHLEKRHHQLKSVQHAAPVLIKNPERIEALFCCQFIALLCCCLIERDLRNAMKRDGVAELPLYPEHRACAQPTAARALELFTGLARHHLTRADGHHVQSFPPQLTALQQQLLH